MSEEYQQKKIDNLTRFADCLIKLVGSLSILTWHGLQSFWQIFMKKPAYTLMKLGLMLIVSIVFAWQDWHLEFMHWIWPKLFHGKFLNWLYSFPVGSQARFLFFSYLFISVIMLGSKVLRKRKKLRECFEAIGLKNGIGLTPALAWHHIIDEFTEEYGFYSKGIGIDRFKASRDALESVLGSEVESISNGDTPSIVVITVTSRVLPSAIYYSDLRVDQDDESESFFIGESKKGILKAKIKDLPHLMIAGTTGGGKSVFFKQAVVGLLETSPRLQVYLIDLKRGLEAKDFEGITNVAIAKDVHGAVAMLGAIEREMERRFKYLESKSFKEIDPGRDKKDRIIVAVDEASELYAEKSKFDSDYELSLKAQKITNSIARLGRAAGIHLILSTQKVNKESINTVIQENISARMCFKMNTLQGSLQVLGNKEALELPATSGRGIWQHGSQEVIVQVPMIDSKTSEAVRYLLGIKTGTGFKKPFQEMLVGQSSGKAIGEKENPARELIANLDT